ncbi:glycosyltransferase family 2 protein [Aliiroseovarius crassostreae]|uniref:glycosyltransferase family 2 protein n=1 Tax=Aliiroseovarius crassostreae TaxID=154981 RepID=UPI0021FA74AB|nr:glycosyltransferase family 2 protein [Aliiroseovarius crassostreae]UWQ10151.1 glycosyltransferase family 2 protein [Aliiroseovarius crassostreae]
MRATAILCVRNEGAFLLEWLAHHRGIGFTDFLVLSNDCDDGTDTMLDRLQDMGELIHIRNDGPYGNGGIQWTGYKLADKHPLVQQSDWLMTLDIDEFVNIHVGDHSLSSLWAALPEADAIPLTWRLFGNAGVLRYQDRPVSEQFTRAAPEVMYWPWRAFMFKTLYRNTGAYRKLGVHRPRDPVDGKVEHTRWFDGQGREMDQRFQKGQIFSPFGQANYGLAQVNHYALGAMESYVLKRARGRAVHDGDLLGLDYWTERNWSDVEDHSIRACDGLRDPHLGRYRSDPTLATLHAQAVDWRKTRFQALMAEEPNRALMGRLMMSPPARPLPLKLARELFQHAQNARGGWD